MLLGSSSKRNLSVSPSKINVRFNFFLFFFFSLSLSLLTLAALAVISFGPRHLHQTHLMNLNPAGTLAVAACLW